MRTNRIKNYMFFKCLCLLALLLCFISCSSDNGSSDDNDSTTTPVSSDESTAENSDDHESKDDYVSDSSSEDDIVLNGDSISENSDGVTVTGRVATITAAGNYSISGTLEDGQIIVDTDDANTVRLILNGVDISSASNAPIVVDNAEKVIIVLTENTVNTVTDAATYVFANADDDEPNAAIFSKSDLTIYGSGSLIVDGNYNDGINAAGGTDSSSQGGRPGQNTYTTSSSYYLHINGGSIYINSTGDGIDINGSIVMTAGTVIVSGPTSNANAALDYDSSFTMSGGFLIAAGSSGMAQAPGSQSSQYAVAVTFQSARSANTLFNLQTSGGDSIVTFAPAKAYQTVVISSPDLAKGTTYNVYSGGSSSGTEVHGLYEGGTYSPGALFRSFTISSIITSVR